VDADSLVRKAYLDNYTMSTSSNGKSHLHWTTLIKTMFSNTSLTEVWRNQGSKYKNKIVKLFQSSWCTIYDNAWRQDLNRNDSKLRTYKDFKLGISLENYLLCGGNVANRKEFTKLRISSHQLRIERGRYTRPRKTPVEDRLCTLCNNGDVETERHYILTCSQFNDERTTLYGQLNSFTDFSALTADQKFIFIMSYNEGDSEVLKYILEFINRSHAVRKSLG
jgi:hypothetical protein